MRLMRICLLSVAVLAMIHPCRADDRLLGQPKNIFVLIVPPGGMPPVHYASLMTQVEQRLKKVGFKLKSGSREDWEKLLLKDKRHAAGLPEKMRQDFLQKRQHQLLKLDIRLLHVLTGRETVYFARVSTRMPVIVRSNKPQFEFAARAVGSDERPGQWVPGRETSASTYETEGQIGMTTNWEDVVTAMLLELETFMNDYFDANNRG